MGDKDAERKMVISIIKSIIVSVKGGLPFHKLDGDYREQNGQRIPYSKFGFSSLEEFIRSISEVKVCRVDGSTMLTVADPKMAHIKSLLDRQKAPKKRKMPKRGYSQKSNYGRPAARPSLRGGASSRPGGLSYRPAPAQVMARRPMEQPRAPPASRRPAEECRAPPRPEHTTNFFTRRPSATETNVGRAVFQQKAYSNTHSIRQGQGFVEYVPLDDPPPKPEVPTETVVQSKSNQDEVNGEESEHETGLLSKRYSDFVRRLDEEQAARKRALLEGRANGSDGPSQTNGRGRGSRKPVEDLTSRLGNVSVSAHNGVGRQAAQQVIVRDAPVSERGSPVKQQTVDTVPVHARLSPAKQQTVIKVPVHARLGPVNQRTVGEVPTSATVSPAKQQIIREAPVSARFSNGDHHPSYVTNGSQDPADRTVEYVTKQNGVGDGLGGALTITIANDFVPGDDDEDWVDYDDDDQDEESCVAYQKLLLRPKFRNHQLIGDDFLLHFANHIDEPCQVAKGGQLSECGLCISGQTVSTCLNEIHQTKIISDRVILLVGAVDLLQGMDFSTLKLRLISLLTELMDKDIKCVYICTLPPLVHLSNGGGYVRKLFNDYIRSMESDTMRVIDLDTEPFVDNDKQMCASYFEESDMQTVNLYSSPVFMRMWNRRGLEAMRNLIQKCLG